jgi:hypothetical protein
MEPLQLGQGGLVLSLPGKQHGLFMLPGQGDGKKVRRKRQHRKQRQHEQGAGL